MLGADSVPSNPQPGAGQGPAAVLLRNRPGGWQAPEDHPFLEDGLQGLLNTGEVDNELKGVIGCEALRAVRKAAAERAKGFQNWIAGHAAARRPGPIFKWTAKHLRGASPWRCPVTCWAATARTPWPRLRTGGLSGPGTGAGTLATWGRSLAC